MGSFIPPPIMPLLVAYNLHTWSNDLPTYRWMYECATPHITTESSSHQWLPHWHARWLNVYLPTGSSKQGHPSCICLCVYPWWHGFKIECKPCIHKSIWDWVCLCAAPAIHSVVDLHLPSPNGFAWGPCHRTCMHMLPLPTQTSKSPFFWLLRSHMYSAGAPTVIYIYIYI